MTTLRHDLRYAARLLRKSPGFTMIAVLTLAIAIGGNTAVFSVVNAVLLRPLPFRAPDSVCFINERLSSIQKTIGPSYPNFADWRAQNQSFEQMAAILNTNPTLTGSGEPERLEGQLASWNLFPLLGISAIEGHPFLPEEDRLEAPPVVLISYSFWQRHFGGARNVLGQTLTLNNLKYTVTGILPAGFQFMQPTDVIMPFEPFAKKLPDDRAWHPGIFAVGRLKPGVTTEAARAEMAGIAARLEQQYPIFNTGVTAEVARVHEQIVQNVRPALLVLLGAVGLVLLIAAANIANLLLARANGRHREIAVRTAMGASRARIIQQVLIESVVLAMVGGAAGVFLAYLVIQPLVQLAANNIPNLGPIELDRTVLVFAAVVAAGAGILFGLAPAFQSVQFDLRSVLNEASRGSTGGARQRKVQSALIIGEIAVALILLVGAGLLLRSFERLQRVPPGFQPDNLLIADVPVSSRAYPKPEQRMAFFDRILERARNIPGVESAGAVAGVPVTNNGSVIYFNIKGRPPKGHEYAAAGYRPVSARYFETLKVPLLRGRLLNDIDAQQGLAVAVVNRAMERKFFGGESALGKYIQLGGLPEEKEPWMEVVGVVGDVKQNLSADAPAEMYIPYRQANRVIPVNTLSLVLRTAADPRGSISALRAAVRELDRDQPVVKIRTMQENISSSVGQPRFRTTLLGIFAASALFLAVIGLYGLMSYSVTQRVQEIGIRVALGAQRTDVVKMIVGYGLKLALAGVLVGLAGALALSRVLTKFLFGISATDVATYAGVSLLLVAVAVFASYVPARRATEVDPIVALRHE